MKLWTWGELKGLVKRQHGIEIDTDYDEPELIEIANRAINKVESKIILLSQDYFITSESMAITSGQSQYDLPDDIYAKKIRLVQVEKDNKTMTLKRIRNLEEVSKKTGLKYLITNSPTGRKMSLFPTPEDNYQMNIWYTRNANRLEENLGDSQIIDIPEYIDAVIAYMAYLIEKKDKSPTTAIAKQDYMEIEKDMIAALAQGVDDEDTEIEPDMDFYIDSTGGY
jgi:hypothetical protein